MPTASRMALSTRHSPFTHEIAAGRCVAEGLSRVHTARSVVGRGACMRCKGCKQSSCESGGQGVSCVLCADCTHARPHAHIALHVERCDKMRGCCLFCVLLLRERSPLEIVLRVSNAGCHHRAQSTLITLLTYTCQHTSHHEREEGAPLWRPRTPTNLECHFTRRVHACGTRTTQGG